MTTSEPDINTFPNVFLKYLAATRPPFLLATLILVLLGLAYTHWRGLPIDAAPAILTLLAALLLHAAVNVLNDYYDALNGTDALNTERVFPFTGGSRFIQNGIMTVQQTRNFGSVLLVSVIMIGIYLISITGVALIWLGLFGLFIGWAYSAPPLRLNSRGLGEISVLAGFTLLPLGSWLVQTGQFSQEIVLIALPCGLLTVNLLFINEFPDRMADIQAGKLHWVARLQPATARWGYLIITLLACLITIILIVFNYLPKSSIISLLPMLLSLKAGSILLRSASRPTQLEPAIKMTIAAMLTHGSLLILIFLTDN